MSIPRPPLTIIHAACLTLVGTCSTVLGIDAAKLAAIKPAMEQSVSSKQAAGIVTLVMEKGKIVHHEAAGMADINAGKKMEKDALFWIASMTKSVNAAAVMTLVDEGKLSLDEPASKWLPELGKMKLADGSMPKTPITLRRLLSHTAGIAFPSRKATDGAISLKSYVASLLRAPLAFEPGSGYEYGFGPTVAGRIIEIVSGMKYDEFLQKRLFAPLGMKDTQFNPDDAHRARIARTYTMDEDTHELRPGYNPFVTSDVSVTHMVEPAARESAGHLLLAGGFGPARRQLSAGRRVDASLLRSLATTAHLRWLRGCLQAGEHPLRSDQQGARRAPRQVKRTR
jgi:CubicO group peptidase (beta-lactamase class C family)